MGFAIALVFCGWAALVIYMFHLAIEHRSRVWLVVCFMLVVLGFGSIFQASIAVKNRKSCLQYETPEYKSLMAAVSPENGG